MGHRELLLVLGAITLFGLTRLSTNRYMVGQNDAVWRREFETYALSLAESYIEEARAKAFFDETLNGGAPAVPAGFTDPDALGPDGAEVYPNFNDVDDFDRFATVDSTKRANFEVSIQVDYVEDTAPTVMVNYETRFKNMTVTVTHNSFINVSFQLSYVFGYTSN